MTPPRGDWRGARLRTSRDDVIGRREAAPAGPVGGCVSGCPRGGRAL